MTTSQKQVLAKAAESFKKGDYKQAKQLYQQASAHFGQNLFAESITLCDRRLDRMGNSNESDQQNSTEPETASQNSATPDKTIDQQLRDTQALLEKYYLRCQELEHSSSTQQP